MSHIVSIGNPKVDEVGSTLNRIFELKKELLLVDPAYPISLDFGNCRFASPTLLMGVYSLYADLSSNGRDVTINTAGTCSSYLNHVSFPDGFRSQKQTEQHVVDSLSYYYGKSYMPLTIVPVKPFPLPQGDDYIKLVKNREKIIQSFVDLVYNQVNASASLQSVISFLLSELTDNMFEHSEAHEGILLAQSYPQKGYLEISFTDLGIGILKSYEKSTLFTPKNSKEAIDFALTGKSTKNDRERGFGISTSKTVLVNGIGGTFLLWSGDALNYHTKHRNEVIEMSVDHSWQQGCFYSLRIPLNIPKDFDINPYLNR